MDRKGWVIFLLFLIILEIYAIPMQDSAFEVNNLFNYSFNSDQTIGEIIFPWPLNNYRLIIDLHQSVAVETPITFLSNQDLISPGETISLSLETQSKTPQIFSYTVTLHVLKENTETWTGSFDVPIPLLKIPDHLSPSYNIPVIPLEIIGIPLEIAVSLEFEIATQIAVDLSAEGLYPSSMQIFFTKDFLRETVAFYKQTGLGAELFVKTTNLIVLTNLNIGIGLNIFGFGLFHYNLIPIHLTRSSTSSQTEYHIWTLKTPIKMSGTASKTIVYTYENIIIKGDISPKQDGILIEVLASQNQESWNTIQTTYTNYDGSFIINLEFEDDGTFFIITRHSETKYSTMAEIAFPQLLILNRPPNATFSYTPEHSTILDNVSFIDTSLDLDGKIVSWYWDFGDGNSSYIKNPMHQYSDKGQYTVSLTVKDDDGDSSNISSKIIIYNIPPSSIFILSNDTPEVGEQIEFIDKSTDPEMKLTSWLWDFGDREKSFNRNSTHIFEQEGTYNVTLTVEDDEGAKDEETRQIQVVRVPPQVNIISPKMNTSVKSSVLSIEWTCSDIGSGIDHSEIKIDEGTWIITTTTKYEMELSEGEHTIYVKAVDKTGLMNQDMVKFVINTSLLGGPGWTDDIIIIGGISAIIIISSFFILKKKKPKK